MFKKILSGILTLSLVVPLLSSFSAITVSAATALQPKTGYHIVYCNNGDPCRNTPVWDKGSATQTVEGIEYLTPCDNYTKTTEVCYHYENFVINNFSLQLLDYYDVEGNPHYYVYTPSDFYSDYFIGTNQVITIPGKFVTNGQNYSVISRRFKSTPDPNDSTAFDEVGTPIPGGTAHVAWDRTYDTFEDNRYFYIDTTSDLCDYNLKGKIIPAMVSRYLYDGISNFEGHNRYWVGGNVYGTPYKGTEAFNYSAEAKNDFLTYVCNLQLKLWYYNETSYGLRAGSCGLPGHPSPASDGEMRWHECEMGYAYIIEKHNIDSYTCQGHYVPNKYDVVFHYNNETDASETIHCEYDKALNITNTIPEYTNYKFLGWTDVAGSDVVKYQPGQEVINLTAEHKGVVHLYGVYQRVYNVSIIDYDCATNEKLGEYVTDAVYANGETVLASISPNTYEGYVLDESKTKDAIINYSNAYAYRFFDSYSTLQINTNGGGIESANGFTLNNDGAYLTNLTHTEITDFPVCINNKVITLTYDTKGIGISDRNSDTASYTFNKYEKASNFAGTYDGSKYIFTGPKDSVSILNATYNLGSMTLPDVTVLPQYANDYAFIGWYSENIDVEDSESHFDSFIGNAGDTVKLDKDTTLYARYSKLYFATTAFPTFNENKGATFAEWEQKDSLNKFFRLYQSENGVNWYLPNTYIPNANELAYFRSHYTYKFR